MRHVISRFGGDAGIPDALRAAAKRALSALRTRRDGEEMDASAM